MIYLRSALFQLWFWLVSIVINIAALPTLLLPRETTLWAAGLWARLVLWGLRVFGGLSYEVRGRANLKPGAALIASKHQTMWETIFVHALLPAPAQVMKRELMRIPFYGWYAAKMAMIIVDRDAQARALKQMLADAAARLRAGRQIVIFPEGTRRPPGSPPDYKPGIAALYRGLGVPCVPMAHNSGLFWPAKGYLVRPGRILVEILPPIAPGLDRRDFMGQLETRIEEATHRLEAEAGFVSPNRVIPAKSVVNSLAD